MNGKPFKSRIHCFFFLNRIKVIDLLENLKSDSVEFAFNSTFAKPVQRLSDVNLATIFNALWLSSSSFIRLLCDIWKRTTIFFITFLFVYITIQFHFSFAVESTSSPSLHQNKQMIMPISPVCSFHRPMYENHSNKIYLPTNSNAITSSFTLIRCGFCLANRKEITIISGFNEICDELSKNRDFCDYELWSFQLDLISYWMEAQQWMTVSSLQKSPPIHDQICKIYIIINLRCCDIFICEIEKLWWTKWCIMRRYLMAA